MNLDERISDEMLISELARRTGVSIRTIRFYITEGLLPSPGVRGRYSVYGEEHLNRLILIQRLKDAHLPLKEIRTQVNQLTGDKVREVLDIKKEIPENPLHKPVNKNPGMKFSPSVSFQKPVEQPRAELDAAGAAAYIERILQVHPAVRWVPEGHAVIEKKVQGQESAVRSAVSNEPVPLEQFRTSDLAPGSNEVMETGQGSLWKRIYLFEGVELHLRQPLTNAALAGVEELIELAKRLWKIE